MHKCASILLCISSIPAIADVVSVTPDKLDFGSQALGTYVFQSATLANPTKKALNISSISAGGDFVIVAQDCYGQLASGSQCGITVRFVPSSVGVETATLTVNDDANNTPQKVKLSGTGTPAQLISIAVTPNGVTVPVGLTQQFVATGTFTDQTSLDLTSIAQWSSSIPTIASVNSTGLVTGLAQGTATISASSDGENGSANVAIAPPLLTSVTLSPSNYSIGLPHQFTLLGTFSDGSAADLSATAAWSSDDPATASVNTSGLVSPHQAGMAEIRAEIVSAAGHGFAKVATMEVAFLGPISTPGFTRTSHTATLLSSGQVLITGGTTINGVISGSEIYNPGTFQFTSGINLTVARAGHTATLLPDGKVLIAGGEGAGTAELYDPLASTSVSTGSMSSPRVRHTATLLNSGLVLIAGGGSATAELYDPLLGIFTPTGSMAMSRSGHTATLLNDGRVLIAGGAPSLAAEIFDPAQGAFIPAGTLRTDRISHAAVLMADGRVFLMGGLSGGVCTASGEMYDPAVGASTASSAMRMARAYHTATPLSNEQILIAGGTDCGFDPSAAAESAERFDPTSGTFAGSGDMEVGHSVGFRIGHTATLLANGQVLLYGGEIPNQSRLGAAELYQPGRPNPPGLQ